MLQDGVLQQSADAKIKDFIKHKLSTATVELLLQPYPEIYLYGKFKNGKQDGGRIEYVKSFSIVAMVVLLIACINFMNLATAQSMKRAKEIGIRKVNGAARKVLIAQFMGEAILYSVAGLAFALLIVELLLPPFRLITEKQINIDYTDPYFLLTLLGISMVTGLVSGSYPALFLSSFNIVSVLKGSLRFSPRSISLRKGLVVFQFCLTIILIFCALVVYQQIQYIKNKNLGFDKENLVLINLEGELTSKIETMVTEASRLVGISSATVTTTSPLQAGNTTVAVVWPGKLPDQRISFTQISVGYDYLKTMGIQLKEGRDFSLDVRSDTAAYIINEAAASRMKLENPLGQEITFWDKPGKIVGVIKNYHLNSLHVQIEPLILHLHPQWSNLMIARTEAGKTPEALEGLRKVTAQLNPAYPFEYHFVDETFERQYKSETTVGKLSNYFSALAIFISCLGLMGLIIFTAEQRTKEIGVRKVLGASVRAILMLLSKDFMILVVIAFFISTPLAWYVMSNWLNNFQYKIDIGWQVFFASGIVSIVIAFITMSLLGLRAALANPVESLRNE
jgi:ABC-type antimicrobial peptide transport system permease subunit